jgi:hypothetical protein
MSAGIISITGGAAKLGMMILASPGMSWGWHGWQPTPPIMEGVDDWR